MPEGRPSQTRSPDSQSAADARASRGPFLSTAQPPWYQLDNQARLFPSILSDRFPTVFRVSAILTEPVRLRALNRAVARSYRRMPLFCVALRRGLFWHYLEECAPASVGLDSGPPCVDRPRYGVRRPLLRVRARGRQIAVEASHIITDGTGATEFLRRLLSYYVEELESTRGADAGRVADRDDQELRAREEEYASRQYAGSTLPPPARYARAWHLPGPRLPTGAYRATVLRYDSQSLRERASFYGVTLTDYVLALFLAALQDRYYALPSRRKRPIRVLVPVNMRPMVGSQTLRNFFVYVMVELDPRLGPYELGEIAVKVHHQMRSELDHRSLRRQLARNVRAERSLAVRLIPIFLKDLILRFVHRVHGERVNTASLSNLGRIELADLVEDRVEHLDFLPPASPLTGVNMTMIGFRDTVSLGFGSTREDTDVERTVAQMLAGEGCIGRVVSNGR